jgi:CheY-like chemotaxis protein
MEKEPHKITVAMSGQEALNKINAEEFDVVLMDIEMPDIKGDDVTRQIRESGNEKIKNLPVIALTGNVMPDDIERFYNAGMNGILAKPIDPDKLKITLAKASQNVFDNPNMRVITPSAPVKKKPVIKQTVIEVHQSGPTTTEQKETEEKTESAPVTKEQVFNTETLDTLKSHIAKKDIEAMLNDLTEKTDEIIEAMNQAIEAQDTETLSARGHELKGMAGNFGLMEISKQGGDIEAKAKTQPIVILTALVSPLPEMQKRAKEALNTWLETTEG